MKALQALVVLIAVLVGSSSSWGAIYFSLGWGANSLDPDWSASDVLISQNGVVSLWLAGDQLGLARDLGGLGGDDLNALSFGWDPVGYPGGSSVYFSVNPAAVGLPGSAVHQQYQAEGSGLVGGIFQSQPPADSNILFRSTEQVGLTRGPFAIFEEDINALSLVGPSPDVYFSIHRDSPSSLDLGFLGSNIYLNDIENLFADYAAIGLDPDDDLDALWLWDVGERGVLDPGTDRAFFSLARHPEAPTLELLDPTTGQPLYSPGDILYTDFTGEFSVWRTASQLGLRPSTVENGVFRFGDELNALSPVVPEPGTLVMWGLLTAGWPLSRSLRKRRPFRKA